jgi:hypothetical protein
MTETDANIQAGATAPVESAQQQADANHQPTEDNKSTEGQTEQNDAGKPEDDEDNKPWPKKAQNALSKEKGKAAKLRWERDQARQEIARLQQSSGAKPQSQTNGTQQNQPADGRPSEKDFNTYADYLEAVNDWKIEQKLADFKKTQQTKEQETQQQNQYAQWEGQRLQAIDKDADVFAKDYPDVQALFNENAELIKSYPPELKRAFLTADKPTLAFYNLAKEGKLDELADMSIEDAKVEIRLAQMQQPASPKSKAPAPLPASRGTATVSKDPSKMTDAEFAKWRRSQIASRR